jgi:hypothetical protein
MHLRTFGSRVACRMTELTFSINTVLCPQITKTIGSTKSKYSEGLHGKSAKFAVCRGYLWTAHLTNQERKTEKMTILDNFKTKLES